MLTHWANVITAPSWCGCVLQLRNYVKLEKRRIIPETRGRMVYFRSLGYRSTFSVYSSSSHVPTNLFVTCGTFTQKKKNLVPKLVRYYSTSWIGKSLLACMSQPLAVQYHSLSCFFFLLLPNSCSVQVSAFLAHYFPKFADFDFTAKMETQVSTLLCQII